MRLLPLPALLVATLAHGQAPPDPMTGTMLEVSAQGHSVRVPDVATIRAGVVAQAPGAAAAMAAQARAMTAVLAALARAGVAPRDVATAQVGLQPQTRYVDGQPPQVTGYQASNSVSVRFRDLARTGAILDALVAAGANQIDGPDLSIDRPDAALDEARADAVTQARARATLYAHAAGLKVTRIVSIVEGAASAGGPRPPVYARAMVAKAETPIAAGEKDVTASITVRFLLD